MPFPSNFNRLDGMGGAMLAAHGLIPPAVVPWMPWIVAGIIIFVGLFIFGWADVVRTHWRRVWAISGVCQTEAVRKNILWITPLAIIGVIGVSQFQHPALPQDAIRQTTKFCLFTSGLLVTITAVILACTNLPREIENRVIFTIVTKPTTRLEIVLGKVVGFARVSGLIILIMGLFTLVYLEARTVPMVNKLREEIASLPADSPLRTSDEYYIHSGLLGTRSLQWCDDMQIYSRPPKEGEQKRWMMGGLGQYFIMPFDLMADGGKMQTLLLAAAEKNVPVMVRVDADIVRGVPDDAQFHQAESMGLVPKPKSKPGESLGPVQPTTGPVVYPPLMAQVVVNFLNENHGSLTAMNTRDSGTAIELKPGDPGQPWSGMSRLTKEGIRRLAATGRFYAQVSARTPAMEFGVGSVPIQIFLPGAGSKRGAADPAGKKRSGRSESSGPADLFFLPGPARNAPSTGRCAVGRSAGGLHVPRHAGQARQGRQGRTASECLDRKDRRL